MTATLLLALALICAPAAEGHALPWGAALIETGQTTGGSFGGSAWRRSEPRSNTAAPIVPVQSAPYRAPDGHGEPRDAGPRGERRNAVDDAEGLARFLFAVFVLVGWLVAHPILAFAALLVVVGGFLMYRIFRDGGPGE